MGGYHELINTESQRSTQWRRGGTTKRIKDLYTCTYIHDTTQSIQHLPIHSPAQRRALTKKLSPNPVSKKMISFVQNLEVHNQYVKS